MVGRWRRRVIAAVATVSFLLALLVLSNRHQGLPDNDSDSNHSHHHHQQQQYADQSTIQGAGWQRINFSSSSRGHSADVDEFRREAVRRPTDRLPTVFVPAPKTTPTAKTSSAAQRPNFVLHRCPASYNINDPQDEWFVGTVLCRIFRRRHGCQFCGGTKLTGLFSRLVYFMWQPKAGLTYNVSYT